MRSSTRDPRRDEAASAQPRRPLRHRLHSDAMRHSIAIVLASLVVFVAVLAIAILTSGDVRLVDSILVAMTLVFAVYGPIFVALTRVAFGDLRGGALRTHLLRSSERSRWVQLLFLGGPKSWATLIVIIGLVSVVTLAATDARESVWLVAACVACVVGTWVLLVGIFAVEYMRGWANDASLRFPGDGEVTISDFLYLSVQLSTTFSSSDVELVDTSARRLATVHSIVAFAYSTVIVAVFASLLISTAA